GCLPLNDLQIDILCREGGFSLAGFRRAQLEHLEGTVNRGDWRLGLNEDRRERVLKKVDVANDICNGRFSFLVFRIRAKEGESLNIADYPCATICYRGFADDHELPAGRFEVDALYRLQNFRVGKGA